MDQKARVERLKATVAKRRAAGLPCGRPKRTDLDHDIGWRLREGQSVVAIARTLGCHPRLVRRVRDHPHAAHHSPAQAPALAPGPHSSPEDA